MAWPLYLAGAAGIGTLVYAAARKAVGLPAIPPWITVHSPAAIKFDPTVGPVQAQTWAPEAGNVKGIVPGDYVFAATAQDSGDPSSPDYVNLTFRVIATDGTTLSVAPGDEPDASLQILQGWGLTYPSQVAVKDVIMRMNRAQANAYTAARIKAEYDFAACTDAGRTDCSYTTIAPQGINVSGFGMRNRMGGMFGVRFGLNPQPLPPKVRTLDPMQRYHARQAQLAHAFGPAGFPATSRGYR